MRHAHQGHGAGAVGVTRGTGVTPKVPPGMGGVQILARALVDILRDGRRFNTFTNILYNVKVKLWLTLQNVVIKDVTNIFLLY